MSAQRRATTRRQSGGGRQRSRGNKADVQEPAVAPERPVDVALEAKQPAKPGPSRATQLQTAGRRLVSLQRTEGLRRFIRETNAELKKVTWPDQQTTRNLTLVVIGVSAVLGVLLGGIDFVLFRLFEAFT